MSTLPKTGVAKATGGDVTITDVKNNAGHFKSPRGENFDNPKVAGGVNGISAIRWLTLSPSLDNEVVSTNGYLSFNADMPNEYQVGDSVRFNPTGVYNATYRVREINGGVVVLNEKYSEYNNGIDPIQKQLGVIGENYDAMINVPHNDVILDKVHKTRAIRTQKVGTAIRNGYWNPVTATWSVEPSETNDISFFGIDHSTLDSADKQSLRTEQAVKEQSRVITGSN